MRPGDILLPPIPVNSEIKCVSGREELLELVPKNGHVIEIGVMRGRFSQEILKRTNPRRMYLLDWWNEDMHMMHYDERGQRVSHLHKKEESYQYVQDLFKDDDRVVLLRGISWHVMTCITPHSLDLAYVDADHRYESVIKDLNSCLRRMKPGGWIMGHDYCVVFPGVVRAVGEFCKTHNLKIDYITTERPYATQPTRGIPTYVSYNSYAIQVK